MTQQKAIIRNAAGFAEISEDPTVGAFTTDSAGNVLPLSVAFTFKELPDAPAPEIQDSDYLDVQFIEATNVRKDLFKKLIVDADGKVKTVARTLEL